MHAWWNGLLPGVICWWLWAALYIYWKIDKKWIIFLIETKFLKEIEVILRGQNL